MKVKNWIHREPITIERTALLQDAVKLMKKHAIRHLPVVDEGDLIGFVTESDLRQFSFPSMVEDIPVHQVMVTKPITIEASQGIEEAARLINDNKIGGLPVLDKGRLVGVITTSDLLSAFIEVMGMLNSSIRLDVLVDEDRGGIDEVMRIIKANGCVVENFATETVSGRKKAYSFRLDSHDRDEVEPAVKALEKAGYKVLSVMD